ncbi:formate/nitrite transporter family protein [Serinicoccus marinus]|uniref:formate/nitrite transporter family protein n=1 Tax=Serinicoccus marinus TaxID=247333 RepID=UPI0003B5C969|nr:formate/nitrite transporter family protein [Serinicoccus marinus]
MSAQDGDLDQSTEPEAGGQGDDYETVEVGGVARRLEEELHEEFNTTVSEGEERLKRTHRGLVVTGLFGGIDVGLGIMAMLAVMHATGSTLLSGLAFGIGLLALRLAHSELFTEDFMLPVNAVLAGHGTAGQLLRLWSVTLVTNLAGGWAFMWLVVYAFPQFHQHLVESAVGYVTAGFTMETVALALLAGSTITLMTRMNQGASSDVMTAIISFIGGFLVVGLEMHHGALSSVLIFGAMQAGAEITVGQWLGWFWWVTLLNMVGGLVIMTALRIVRTWELVREERSRRLSAGQAH